jgi:D-arabinose 5-phosphate isomerase GutQ
MVQQSSQRRPVQNSEVYVLSQVPPFPPLCPPSPITPAEDFDDAPADARSLTQPDIAVCGKRLAIEERLSRAVHVIATETAALHNLTHLYSSDSCARDGFTRAVDTITSRHRNGGKLVVIGVGKSGHIAKKLVATFNSFSITAVFLHPTEALHGDLGQISPHDTLVMITFSGKTPELMTLLPHLDVSLPLLVLTSHTSPETCELIRYRPNAILLPAPVHESETTSFGVAAPTTSTTVALTIGDALAVVVSQELFPSVASVFSRNHPGGAIGAAFSQKQPQQQPPATPLSPPAQPSLATQPSPATQQPPTPRQQQRLPLTVFSAPTIRTLMVPLTTIPTLEAPPPHTTTTNTPPKPLTGLDVLRTGYASPSGWVWVRLSPPPPNNNNNNNNNNNSTSTTGNEGVVSPRRIRRMDDADVARPLDETGLVTPRKAFISVEAGTSVQVVRERVLGLRAAAAAAAAAADGGGKGEGEYGDEAILQVVDRGECMGLLEVGRLFEEEEA